MSDGKAISVDELDSLNSVGLAQRLSAAGWNCTAHPTPDDSFGELTDEHIIVCKERSDLESHAPKIGAGISFWMRCGTGLLFASTWNYVLYRLHERTAVCEFVSAFLSGSHCHTGVTPYHVPSVLVSRCGLRRCGIVQAWPRNASRLLQPDGQNYAPGLLRLERRFTRQEVIHGLALCGGFAGPDRYDLGEVSRGEARATVRMISKGAQRTRRVCIVVDGDGLACTPDHPLLLHAIAESLDASLYDLGWGTVVDWDDPYYQFMPEAKRPDRPRDC